jgi:hypothetical protein
MVRRGNNPRLQGWIICPAMGWLAHRRVFSFDALLRLEWVVRRLLGQPLSRRAWPRMTFNDKLNYRRLRDRDPAFQVFCDKLAMRDYVSGRLGAESLPGVLAVGDGAGQFSERKGPYVLKANHGSGMVTFVDEGQALSVDQLREAGAWLTCDYGWRGLEWAYVGARRLLLAEEPLRSSGGSIPPPEYKLWTFGGNVEMIQVDTERFRDHRRMLRRPDWSPIAGTLLYPPPDDPDQARPPNLGLMLQWASELGRDHDFVRVDLYDSGDRIYVSELTPYPGGARVRFRPAGLDAWLGTMWPRNPPG